MDRAELERLDRESLVLRAQAAGIKRARVLTRPEIVDELLRMGADAGNIDEAQLKKTRGFFGRARDLLSRVVERGLHLPDAADRLRQALGKESNFPQVPRPEPQAIPTVTLAEIYAAQGHKGRAIETLERVLEAEPEHGAARALLEKLQSSAYVGPKPVLPPEEEVSDEIGANLGNRDDVETLPDVEAVAVPPLPIPSSIPDPSIQEMLRAYVEEEEPPVLSAEPSQELANVLLAAQSAVPPPSPSEIDLPSVVMPPPSSSPETPRISDEPATLPREKLARRIAAQTDECIAIPIGGGTTYVWWRLMPKPREGRTLVIRAIVLMPTWDGPRVTTRDLPQRDDSGETLLHGLPDRAVVRVAIGHVSESSRQDFVPLAHSPALETNKSRELMRWTLDGSAPVMLEDPASASIARAAEGAVRAVRAQQRGRR